MVDLHAQPFSTSTPLYGSHPFRLLKPSRHLASVTPYLAHFHSALFPFPAFRAPITCFRGLGAMRSVCVDGFRPQDNVLLLLTKVFRILNQQICRIIAWLPFRTIHFSV